MRVFLTLQCLTVARTAGSRRRRGHWVGMGSVAQPAQRLLGTQAGWGAKGGGGGRSPIQCLPGPALATSGQEVQAVPRPLRGRGKPWQVRLLGRAGERSGKQAGGLPILGRAH